MIKRMLNTNLVTIEQVVNTMVHRHYHRSPSFSESQTSRSSPFLRQGSSLFSLENNFEPSFQPSSVTSRLLHSILPKGFPTSVRPGFARFHLFSTAGLLVESFSAAIGTHQLLGAFFSDSTAAMWLAKDVLPTLLATGTLLSLPFTQTPIISALLTAQLFQLTSLFEFGIGHWLTTSSGSFPLLLLFASMLSSMSRSMLSVMRTVTQAMLCEDLAIAGNLGDVMQRMRSLQMSIFALGTAIGLSVASHVSITTQAWLMVLSCCLNPLLWAYAMKGLVPRRLSWASLTLNVRRFNQQLPMLSPVQAAVGAGVFGFHKADEDNNVGNHHPHCCQLWIFLTSNYSRQRLIRRWHAWRRLQSYRSLIHLNTERILLSPTITHLPLAQRQEIYKWIQNRNHGAIWFEKFSMDLTSRKELQCESQQFKTVLAHHRQQRCQVDRIQQSQPTSSQRVWILLLREDASLRELIRFLMQLEKNEFFEEKKEEERVDSCCQQLEQLGWQLETMPDDLSKRIGLE